MVLQGCIFFCLTQKYDQITIKNIDEKRGENAKISNLIYTPVGPVVLTKRRRENLVNWFDPPVPFVNMSA